MSQDKQKVMHYAIDLKGDKRVSLGEYERDGKQSFSIVLERPLKEDEAEPYECVSVRDDRMITHIGLSMEAMDALVQIYNERFDPKAQLQEIIYKILESESETSK